MSWVLNMLGAWQVLLHSNRNPVATVTQWFWISRCPADALLLGEDEKRY